MLVEEIIKIMLHAKVGYVDKNEDLRDYRVNFDKIKRELEFEISMRVPDGIKKIAQLISQDIIQNTYDKKYYNVPFKG